MAFYFCCAFLVLHCIFFNKLFVLKLLSAIKSIHTRVAESCFRDTWSAKGVVDI